MDMAEAGLSAVIGIRLTPESRLVRVKTVGEDRLCSVKRILGLVECLPGIGIVITVDVLEREIADSEVETSSPVTAGSRLLPEVRGDADPFSAEVTAKTTPKTEDITTKTVGSVVVRGSETRVGLPIEMSTE